MDISSEPYIIFANVPLQSNYYDCGIYLLQYMEIFMNNPDMYLKLIMTSKNTKEYFTSPDISNKRIMLVELIQKLSKEYKEKKKNDLSKVKKEDDEDIIMETTNITVKKETKPTSETKSLSSLNSTSHHNPTSTFAPPYSHSHRIHSINPSSSSTVHSNSKSLISTESNHGMRSTMMMPKAKSKTSSLPNKSKTFKKPTVIIPKKSNKEMASSSSKMINDSTKTNSSTSSNSLNKRKSSPSLDSLTTSSPKSKRKTLSTSTSPAHNTNKNNIITIDSTSHTTAVPTRSSPSSKLRNKMRLMKDKKDFTQQINNKLSQKYEPVIIEDISSKEDRHHHKNINNDDYMNID